MYNNTIAQDQKLPQSTKHKDIHLRAVWYYHIVQREGYPPEKYCAVVYQAATTSVSCRHDNLGIIIL